MSKVDDRDYYLTLNWSEKHYAFLAVITLGSAQSGDENVDVMDSNTFPNKDEAMKWFKAQVHDEPWFG